jgi:hypothetical protein
MGETDEARAIIDETLRGLIRELVKLDDQRWRIRIEMETDSWDSRIVVLPGELIVSRSTSHIPMRHVHLLVVELQPGQTLALRFGPAIATMGASDG